MRILVILISIVLFGCQNKVTPLESAIDEIKALWTKEQLIEFARKPDSVALSEIHFGYAMYFRNEKIRNTKDTTLINYFHTLGVNHEDYMSGIVFTSLHRQLNNKPIDLEGQLMLIHNQEKLKKEVEERNKVRALNYYTKFSKGDTIVIRMPIGGFKNAFMYVDPDDKNWIHNDTLDLLMDGVILKKSSINNTAIPYFKIKILNKNKNDIKILGEEVNLGDEIDVDLNYNILEVKN